MSVPALSAYKVAMFIDGLPPMPITKPWVMGGVCSQDHNKNKHHRCDMTESWTIKGVCNNHHIRKIINRRKQVVILLILLILILTILLISILIILLILLVIIVMITTFLVRGLGVYLDPLTLVNSSCPRFRIFAK
jgi:hypothetical protein